MRFTSLIVELIRARPQLIVTLALLVQAVVWIIVPLLVYSSPPGDLPLILAFGKEYQLGTDLGPPLAFWAADIAYRAFGGHILGVYILAQVCFVVSFLALYRLGSALLGAPHAAVAVLVTQTVTAYASLDQIFGPDQMALPLYALTMLFGWQAMGEGQRSAWFPMAVAAGFLLITSSAAPWLLGLIVLFLIVSPNGRRNTANIDAAFALIVLLLIAVPWFIWLGRNSTLVWPDWSQLALPDEPVAAGQKIARSLAGKLLALMPLILGALVLAFIGANWGVQEKDPALIVRSRPTRQARAFIWAFALVPAFLSAMFASLAPANQWAAGPGIVLLFTGLLIVLRAGDAFPLRRERAQRIVWALSLAIPVGIVLFHVFVSPWVSTAERATSLPGRDIASFFTESYERRTGKRLAVVGGDPQLAALVSLGKGRPQLLLDETPQRTPWASSEQLIIHGGLVVWRAADTTGTPPAALRERFPGLTPEVPQAFDRMVDGNLPVLRIGWAIIRPRIQ